MEKIQLAALWPGKTLVIVASLTDKQPTAASIALPAAVVGEPRPVFPGRPSGLKRAAGGTLTGEVGPAEVHVYRFNVDP